jgi:hypothetical protein
MLIVPLPANAKTGTVGPAISAGDATLMKRSLTMQTADVIIKVKKLGRLRATWQMANGVMGNGENAA